MTLVDAGPLIALIDKGQGEVHTRCKDALQGLSSPLLTTRPRFTEAMYFLGELRGWPGQTALWAFIERDALLIHPLAEEEVKRMAELMEQYKNLPMDLADASLVSLAEAKNLRRVFTLDTDFYVYRINGKDAFQVIP
jgi:predicted nucleic acid-binding protein